MQSNFQSHPDQKLEFRISEIAGEEVPYSRHTLKVQAADESGKVVDLSIQLTVPQLADIVRHFFWEVTVRGAWAAKILERLLRKRWGVYTKPTWKLVDECNEGAHYEKYRARCTELDFEFVDGQRIMRKGEEND